MIGQPFGHGLALPAAQGRELAVQLPLNPARGVEHRLAVPHAKQLHDRIRLPRNNHPQPVSLIGQPGLGKPRASVARRGRRWRVAATVAR